MLRYTEDLQEQLDFRFFRSIRQSLLSEGKTAKYLKYAVGEFLLIVAGILVALQIQNWNEERKIKQDRRELIEYLVGRPCVVAIIDPDAVTYYANATHGEAGIYAGGTVGH